MLNLATDPVLSELYGRYQAAEPTIEKLEEAAEPGSKAWALIEKQAASAYPLLNKAAGIDRLLKERPELYDVWTLEAAGG